MKFYMSYWHTDMTSKYLGGNSKFLDEAKDFYKVSAYLIKKHYGNVNLITDFRGMKEFRDVAQWDSIDLSLETLPKEYKKVWSLGKIKAIRNLSLKKEPFLHVDHDVFIIKKISESILNSELILQSFDSLPLNGVLSIFFNGQCKNKYLAGDTIPRKHYNCGIIGGANFNIIGEFADSSIKMILDERNKNFWLDNNENEFLLEYFSKALIAEQYYLSAFIQNKNIIPKLLIDSNYYPKISDIEEGYVHLYGEKKYRYKYLFDKIKNNINSGIL